MKIVRREEIKTFVVLAVVIAGMPLAAAAADESDSSARSEGQRRVCTRIERYSGSRMSFQRVCLTEAEWRDRLGPDWRQRLAGHNNPQEDLESVDGRTRVFSDQPVPTTGDLPSREPYRIPR